MILDKVKNTLSNGIARYAKEAELPESDVQFLIEIELTEDSGDVVYFLLHKFNKVKKITFKEIMNVKIDILGQGIIVTNFIARYMMTIAEENAKDISDIYVIILKQNDNLRLFEYYKGDFVKELYLNDIVQT
jgi:hypothetical protein